MTARFPRDIRPTPCYRTDAGREALTAGLAQALDTLK
jgi:hypothetical protein